VEICNDQVKAKIEQEGYIFGAAVSEAKNGKSRLLTSCVEYPEFRPAILVGFDPKGEVMKSTLPQHKAHIRQVIPGIRAATDVEIKAKEEGGAQGLNTYFDPRFQAWKTRVSMSEDCLRIASHDWAGEGYKTLIIDTGSIAAQMILSEIAAAGHSDKYGQKRHHWEKRGATDIPFEKRTLTSANQPDYGLAQDFVLHRLLFPLASQACHVLTAWHLDIDLDKKVAGPATVGRALISRLPGLFDFVFGPKVFPVQGGKPKFRVRMTEEMIGGTFKIPYGLRECLSDPSEVFKGDYIDLESPNPAPFWKKILEIVQANPVSAPQGQPTAELLEGVRDPRAKIEGAKK
jgi:hypothetical protein